MPKLPNTQYTKELPTKIAQHFHGHFAIYAGTDGCDKTVDVYCDTTSTHLLSVPYWEAEDEARVIAEFSNSQLGRD